MQQLSKTRVQRRMGRVLGRAAAVLLFATALRQSGIAYSGPHGGGGLFSRGLRVSRRRVSLRRIRRAGMDLLSTPIRMGFVSDYRYDSGQPCTSQTRYYRSDPAGCYPYITQRHTGWQRFRLADSPVLR